MLYVMILYGSTNGKGFDLVLLSYHRVVQDSNLAFLKQTVKIKNWFIRKLLLKWDKLPEQNTIQQI
jgi:hypothetical protein